MGKEQELKVGLITKRAQQKRSISRANYKDRILVLTPTKLAYYEGTLNHRGKLKGSFSLDTISFVGAINLKELRKTWIFLIIHDGCYLYCCTKNQSDCNSWVEEIKKACQNYGNSNQLQQVYHPKLYSHGKWQCCNATQKLAKGCTDFCEGLDVHIGSQYSVSAPGSPASGTLQTFEFGTSTINKSSTLAVPVMYGNNYGFSQKPSAYGSGLMSFQLKKAKSEQTLFFPETNYSKASMQFPSESRSWQKRWSENPATPIINSCQSFSSSHEFDMIKVYSPELSSFSSSSDDYRAVIAVYDYQPIENGDISLELGKRYFVIDDSRPYWWFVRNENGIDGYVPSNYVEDEDKDAVETKCWFQGDMSRQRAEYLLKQDGQEGSFIVRKSSHDSVIYSVSVVTKHGRNAPAPSVGHYHIKKNEEGLYYLSLKHPMNSIVELIEYHRHNASGLITRLRQAPRYLLKQPPTHLFSNSQWEMRIDDLKMSRELGSGQFGVVNLAFYRGKQKVAVKIMKENSMEESDFLEEAEVMTKLRHRNLVELYGVVTHVRPFCIVTEYMEDGSLLKYIRAHSSLHTHADIMVDIICQICDGMKYLESESIIHRDLAARNCLVGRNMVVKVADFGLSRYVLDDEYVSSAGAKFPIKWSAPEVLNYTTFSSKSDVWAFGILIWELFSGGKIPYPSMSNSDVASQISIGYRMDRPRTCPHDIYAVMRRTWHDDPFKRPSFSELLKVFFDISDTINAASVPAGSLVENLHI